MAAISPWKNQKSEIRQFIMPNVNFLHKSYYIINNIEDNTIYNYTFYNLQLYILQGLHYSRNCTLYNIHNYFTLYKFMDLVVID